MNKFVIAALVYLAGGLYLLGAILPASMAQALIVSAAIAITAVVVAAFYAAIENR